MHSSVQLAVIKSRHNSLYFNDVSCLKLDFKARYGQYNAKIVRNEFTLLTHVYVYYSIIRLSRSHAYCLTSLVVCNKYKYFEYLFVDAKDLKDNIASKEGTIIVII